MPLQLLRRRGQGAAAHRGQAPLEVQEEGLRSVTMITIFVICLYYYDSLYLFALSGSQTFRETPYKIIRT